MIEAKTFLGGKKKSVFAKEKGMCKDRFCLKGHLSSAEADTAPWTPTVLSVLLLETAWCKQPALYGRGGEEELR